MADQEKKVKKDNRLQEFYNNILKTNKVDDAFFGGYDMFETKIQDSALRQKAYDNMLTNGLTSRELGTPEQFHGWFDNYFKTSSVTGAQDNQGKEINIHDQQKGMSVVEDENGEKKIITDDNINPETITSATKEDIAVAAEEAQKPQPETLNMQLQIDKDVVDFAVIADPNTNLLTIDSTFANLKDAEKVQEAANSEYDNNFEIIKETSKNGVLNRNVYKLQSKLQNTNDQETSQVVKNAQGEDPEDLQTAQQDENGKPSAYEANVIQAYEQEEAARREGNPVKAEQAQENIKNVEAEQTLAETETGAAITTDVSKLSDDDMFMTDIPFTSGKDAMMEKFGGEQERAIDMATERRNVGRNDYYLNKGYDVVDNASITANTEIAADKTFKDEEKEVARIIADLRENEDFKGKLWDKQREGLKKQLSDMGYDPEGWMNYKTGQRNKEGEYEGYATEVNSTVEELKDTPQDQLKNMAEKQWVVLNYLQSEYDKADKLMSAARISGGQPYSTSMTGAISFPSNTDTPEFKRAEAIHNRIGGTKERAGELAQAKAAFEGISRAYYLNESPDVEKSTGREVGEFAHTAAKGFIEGSLLVSSAMKLFGGEMAPSENEKKIALAGAFDMHGFRPTIAEQEAMKLSFADKLSSGLGATGGIILDFAALEAIGGAVGIPKLIAGMRNQATIAKQFGEAYRVKQLKTFLSESLYEEVKFGAIGGDFGQGTLFGQVGKVLNKVPYLKRKPFDKWYTDVPKSLLKADLSMTSTVYTIDAINATTDALINDKEWKYQMQKHFGNDLGEFGERVMTDLATNWMFGVKQTVAQSFMDKATLNAEAQYMSKFAKDRNFKKEAEDIENMVDGFKSGDVSGKEVLSRIQGRNKYYQARQILFDLNRSEQFNGEEFKPYKKAIADIITSYDAKPTLEQIVEINKKVDALKSEFKEETKSYLDFRSEEAKKGAKQAE